MKKYILISFSVLIALGTFALGSDLNPFQGDPLALQVPDAQSSGAAPLLNEDGTISLSPRPKDGPQGGIDFSTFVYNPDAPFLKPDDQTLYNQLNDESFAVTQRCGTEMPFENAYWDHKEKGIYVDIVSGEPLFASIHKYDSGTGWPSFYRPIEEAVIEVIVPEDNNFGIDYEVKSAKAASHLGHVYDDGPSPTGLRFCINSASLHFIAYEDMAARGYGYLLPIFDSAEQNN